MVILRPIDQLGWHSASSGVARASCSRLQVRNGPPEAVSTMRSMVAGSAPAIAWNTAECSESTGSSSVPASRTACMNMRPASTRHSLLASATRRPCETAASVGRSPAAPMMPATTQSAGRMAASASAAGTRSGLDAGAGETRLQRRVVPIVADHGHRRAMPHGQLGQRVDVAVAGQRYHLEHMGIAAHQVERAAPHRAGRAQHADALALRGLRAHAARDHLGRRTGARLRHAAHPLHHESEQQRARRRMHVDRRGRSGPPPMPPRPGHRRDP